MNERLQRNKPEVQNFSTSKVKFLVVIYDETKFEVYAGRKKKEVINKDKFMLALCFVLLLLLVPSQSTLICSECSASVSNVLNISVDFERILHFHPPRNYNFSLQELRPGVCEATVAYINDLFYIHKESRSRAGLNERFEVNTLHLRYK